VRAISRMCARVRECTRFRGFCGCSRVIHEFVFCTPFAISRCLACMRSALRVFTNSRIREFEKKIKKRFANSANIREYASCSARIIAFTNCFHDHSHHCSRTCVPEYTMIWCILSRVFAKRGHPPVHHECGEVLREHLSRVSAFRGATRTQRDDGVKHRVLCSPIAGFVCDHVPLREQRSRSGSDARAVRV
jgi:hypothetical protein